jgi:hypothetical protein
LAEASLGFEKSEASLEDEKERLQSPVQKDSKFIREIQGPIL